MKHVYLALCVIGFLLPYSQFVPWLTTHGLNLPLLIHDLFANRISAFFGLDVLISAIVTWIIITTEGHRLGIRHLWLPIIATGVVGASLGLPLFFYLRQLHMDRTFDERERAR
jgi:hypothetical protein